MSGPDLTRLRSLDKAATPAPWHATDSETAYDMPASGMAVVSKGDYDPPAVALICDEWYENDPGEPSPSDDAFLIAAMRNALPALLDLVDAQASEIAAQAKQLDDVRALADWWTTEADTTLRGMAAKVARDHASDLRNYTTPTETKD